MTLTDIVVVPPMSGAWRILQLADKFGRTGTHIHPEEHPDSSLQWALEDHLDVEGYVLTNPHGFRVLLENTTFKWRPFVVHYPLDILIERVRAHKFTADGFTLGKDSIRPYAEWIFKQTKQFSERFSLFDRRVYSIENAIEHLIPSSSPVVFSHPFDRRSFKHPSTFLLHPPTPLEFNELYDLESGPPFPCQR
jgi:hypothetical protein